FEIVDVTDEESLLAVCQKHEVDTIMHLAALLSAKAESIPRKAWDINMGGLMNALEVARKLNLQFFTPSSIGSFGPSTPKKIRRKIRFNVRQRCMASIRWQANYYVTIIMNVLASIRVVCVFQA